MRRALALLSLACLSACFPDYKVLDQPIVGDGGDGGTGGSTPVEPSCTDGTKNGKETGKDCGMDACGVGCDAGMGCLGDVDCKVGLCANLVCQAASCSDQLVNGGETDKDCGGDMGCNRCMPGQHCLMSSDCDGGACVNGQCKAPSCKDSLLNGDETDQDCGGSCDPCGVGKLCAETKDCDALLCAKGKCQPPACDDKILNQDESAADCGGSCAPCADGVDCNVGMDCTSGVCGTDKTCAIPSCIDKVKNGKEPTVDCGIDCPNKCKTLDACNVDNDCAATNGCVDGRCIPKTATNKALSPLGWVASSLVRSDNSKDSYLIDGNAVNSWWISGTNQTAGQWIEVDMLKTQYVFSVQLQCTDTGSCNDPDPDKNDLAAGINIQFADTDTDWPNVTPVLVDYLPAVNEIIKLPKVGVGRYMRVTLSQGKTRWWRVDELVLRQ